MSGNSFGHLFRFTTWGESHGPAIGCVIDGVPPLVDMSEAIIQPFLDKRKPGQSQFTTQRREADQVKILSGVFEGKTTGTPICLMIENTDQRSKDYGDIAQKFRPGHADYTYQHKFGIRDYRGGGRSSARETASRVAAGAVARTALNTLVDGGVMIRGALVQIGPHKINRDHWDWQQVSQNPFFCPDVETVPVWENYLHQIRKDGLSAGAVIEIVASNAPAGLGHGIYQKLDSDLSTAMMTINAVKGVEIGRGFEAATLDGAENADEMYMSDVGDGSGDGSDIRFASNNAGGILGGISTGEDIVVRFAVKPTSSILKSRKTITKSGEETDIVTKGRHDPCVGIRAVPVGEAMMATVILDHLLLDRGQCAHVERTL